ncbi:hypothetical protein PMI04_016800 [Sphingobium sp. AP49]|uniref:hypothetical protein n=1 Tax=Sphingobium sp. AP49 TaxID=1144307 RepID=UPI00026ECB49|nr:hypothetical protein [Sphingobium sp. AP49]WHO38200.1 hypothetical protein PMI04_016800 [Sphingobium sp. AP49]
MSPLGMAYFKWASVALFVACLPLPGVCTAGHCGLGISYLVFGSIGFLAGWANLSWLANPILLLSWKYGRRRNGLVGLSSAFVALLFASIPLMVSDIVTNEGGVATGIEGFGVGYWLWMAAIGVMVAGYIFEWAGWRRKMA